MTSSLTFTYSVHMLVIRKYSAKPAAPLSYTARLCTFRIHHIRFYTLSIAHAPFTTHFDCHSSGYFTPQLPTFRLRTFGHPHLRCYALLFLHKAIVHNAFATHPKSTQPIHHVPFLHNRVLLSRNLGFFEVLGRSKRKIQDYHSPMWITLLFTARE